MSARSTALRFVSEVTPRTANWIRENFGDSGKQLRIGNAMRAAGFCGKVMFGPFAGLNYDDVTACGSVRLPKLLGTYELELLDAINEIISTRPSLVIDIGAAEGYYAVGLATRLGDNSEVVAFEMSAAALGELTSMAEKNGVANRIRCFGECRLPELADCLQPDCLVICDCEGAELALLDPTQLPQLREAAILVELHNGQVDDIADEFRTRFSTSHSIRHFAAKQRTPSDCSILQKLRHRDVAVALNEHRRLGIQWLWMKPLRSQLWASSANGAAL